MKTDIGISTREKKLTDGEEIKIPCEVYSRIVGYLRPIQNWNKGKQQEFKERKTFRVDKRTAR
jgi:anaerobic ribonucleoside-triphosphate reductase